MFSVPVRYSTKKPDTLNCFYLLSAPRSNTAPLSETQGYARRWRVGYLGGGSWWGREDVPDYARTRAYGRRFWSRRNLRQDLPGNVPLKRAPPRRYRTRGLRLPLYEVERRDGCVVFWLLRGDKKG